MLELVGEEKEWMERETRGAGVIEFGLERSRVEAIALRSPRGSDREVVCEEE